MQIIITALVLVSLTLHYTYAVWSCPGKEFKYKCGRTDLQLLGIYMNTEKVPTKKSIGLIDSGVLVQESHIVNYKQLSSAARYGWTHQPPKMERSRPVNWTILIPPESTALVYQETSSCDVLDLTEPAWRPNTSIIVTLVAPPFTENLPMNSTTCTDRIENVGTQLNMDEVKTVVASYEYSVGVNFSISRDSLHPLPREGDDREAFLEWLNAKLEHNTPSLRTGLDWTNHKINKFDEGTQSYAIRVPPQKFGFVFQAEAYCVYGGNISNTIVRMYGWAFHALSLPSYHTGSKCESPEFQPDCVQVGSNIPGTPASWFNQIWGGCNDSFEELGVGRQNSTLTLVHGSQGYLASHVSDQLKAVFMGKLKQLGASGRTKYNWSQADENLFSWSPFGTEEQLEVEKESSVLQLVITCGDSSMLTMHTKIPAIIRKDDMNKCLSVTGLALTCSNWSEYPWFGSWDL